jgi:hypothetical protein
MYRTARRLEAASLIVRAARLLELVPEPVDGEAGREARHLLIIAGRVRGTR